MKIEDLIGKKNYKKQLEKDSFQYGLPVSRNTQSLKFRNLLQETAGKRANIYIKTIKYLYGIKILMVMIKNLNNLIL